MENQNLYALLVGVGNYAELNITNLPAYRMDLALIGTAITEGLKACPENIRIMAGDNNDGIVRTTDFARAFKGFSALLKTDDTFILYFSGHGLEKRLLFSDGAVDLQSIIDLTQRLPAKNKVVILDCCYAGDFRVQGPMQLEALDSLENFAGRGIAILASNSANEPARLGPFGRHSMFTGALSTAILGEEVLEFTMSETPASAVEKQELPKMSASASKNQENREVSASVQKPQDSRHSAFTPAFRHKRTRAGMLDLNDIVSETRRLIAVWNRLNPGKEQTPIFRASLGGSIFFPVEEYHPYRPMRYGRESKRYIIAKVAPNHPCGNSPINPLALPARVQIQPPDILRDLPADIRKHFLRKLSLQNNIGTEPVLLGRVQGLHPVNDIAFAFPAVPHGTIGIIFLHGKEYASP